MRSLLLIAHGSRRKESNEEIRMLTARLSEKAIPKFDFVTCAFLEIEEPSIAQGIQTCANAGATEIIVFPYFLSVGNHVASDIPAEIDTQRKEYPDITIKITEHIGKSKHMADILLSLAE